MIYKHNSTIGFAPTSAHLSPNTNPTLCPIKSMSLPESEVVDWYPVPLPIDIEIKQPADSTKQMLAIRSLKIDSFGCVKASMHSWNA